MSFEFELMRVNNDYTTPLIQFTDANNKTYQQVLNDCQNEIIDAFDGLDTMIHLCLTNPKFLTNEYKSQYNAFMNLMESKNIMIDNNIYMQKTTTSDMYSEKHGDVILFDFEKFSKYSFGILANYSDCLYFIVLPTTRARYIFNNILHAKAYPVCSASTSTIIFVLGQIYAVCFDYDTIYYLLIIIAYSIGIVVCLTYILSANISIVKLIIQTFDFWYKVYNLILWIVSSYFAIPWFRINTGYYIISSLAVICGFGLSFVLDGISIEIKYKNFYIIVTVLWGMYAVIMVYFYIDDTNNYWNPFKQHNFHYSRINFKNVFISSQFNLCLFMLKPIFSQINGKIKKCLCNIRKKKNVTKDDKLFVERSYNLYKRPCVHWMRE